MSRRKTFRGLWRDGLAILDGGTGTELQRVGMPAGVSPEAWCLAHPDTLSGIHRAYLDAGAAILYTCTFGGSRPKLAPYGHTDVHAINRDLARLARRAAGRRALVAGDIGATGRFVEPFGDLPFDEAVAIFREQAAGLLEGGVDLFVIETMLDIQEARAALIAVKEICRLPVMVTMTYEADGRTLNGTDPVTALITLQALGADAVGCNCSTGPEAMVPLIAAMKPYATVPLMAKPNAGMPRLVGDKTLFDMAPEAFGAAARELAAAGANLIGGCCGTTAAHIAALRTTLDGVAPQPPRRRSLAAISSARAHRIFAPGDPLVVIGERLNPTGKKALQQELREGKLALVRRMAREQEERGADLLDVNVGVPDIDEVETIRAVVRLLAAATPLPLCLDSARVDTLAAALRLYPGRAPINSISGESEKMAELLPLAARYGAMFILLPLAGGEVPATAEKRMQIVRDVYRAARRHGFTKEDIVVDGLVMTVASNPRAAAETLKTVAWSAERFGARTVLGLSNVSFGMPERDRLNSAFLTMAQAAGLTMAIANPSSDVLADARRAGDVLLGRDRDAAAYIAHATQTAPSVEPVPPAADPGSPEERVREAILDGNREEIVARVDAALAAGIPADRLVDDCLIPAIVEVGDRYDKKTYFLPQLIAAAEAMKAALARLEPLLRREGTARAHRGTVLMATVAGDIHDIGKNIVVLMLRNHGFDIVDLGKDVTAEAIVAAAQEHRPEVIGLSALMTTTMVRMKDVIARAADAGLAAKFMVGGAVVTAGFAASIGASYARDGVEAVRVATALVGEVRSAQPVM